MTSCPLPAKRHSLGSLRGKLAMNALPTGSILAHSSQAFLPGSSMSNIKIISSNLSKYSRLDSIAFLAACAPLGTLTVAHLLP